MNGSDSDAGGQAAPGLDASGQGEAPAQRQVPGERQAQGEADTKAQKEADRASEGLRGQIAALRQQVKDAQDTLRDHERRRNGRPQSKR